MTFKFLATAVSTAVIILATPLPAFAEDGFPLTITDAAGVEHTFDAPPKIGCLWSGCIELFADLGEQVYAGKVYESESQEDSKFDFPVGLPANLIEDGSNPEHWAAAGVDVIITRVPFGTWAEQLVDVASIVHLHHPSYGKSSQTGYQAYIENLRLFGQLVGRTDAAEAAIERFDNMIANLKVKATSETAATKVAVIWGGDDTEVYYTVGTVNPFCVLIDEIGVGKCAADEAVGEIEMNAEAFLKLDPDWIVYMNGGSEGRDDPIWERLSAVKNGQVIDAGDRFYCCSTRGLIHALQDYTHYVLDSTIPAPGKLEDFDPTTSPLVMAAQ